MASFKRKIISIPFFYDRAIFYLKIINAKNFKLKLLIILLDIVSKFFRRRSDFFEVSLLLNSIYEQYNINPKELPVDLRPLETGLYGTHDPKTITRKKDFLERMEILEMPKRYFSYQGKIALLEYAISGGKPRYYKAKEGEITVSEKNYPNLKEGEMILGPDLYISIGHMCLLGYFGLAYPKKFTLIIVEGAKISNEDLLETISHNFKIIKCKPIIYSSLIISQSSKLVSIETSNVLRFLLFIPMILQSDSNAISSSFLS